MCSAADGPWRCVMLPILWRATSSNAIPHGRICSWTAWLAQTCALLGFGCMACLFKHPGVGSSNLVESTSSNVRPQSSVTLCFGSIEAGEKYELRLESTRHSSLTK
ncbi:hypothetical protein BJX62DRAFT_94478 [Aspergillus germanicus]